MCVVFVLACMLMYSYVESRGKHWISSSIALCLISLNYTFQDLPVFSLQLWGYRQACHAGCLLVLGIHSCSHSGTEIALAH